jgi:hypothetical protein
MYKVHLFQYESQFNTVFNVNPGNQDSPMTFVFTPCKLSGKSNYLLENTTSFFFLIYTED